MRKETLEAIQRFLETTTTSSITFIGMFGIIVFSLSIAVISNFQTHSPWVVPCVILAIFLAFAFTLLFFVILFGICNSISKYIKKHFDE